MLEAGVVDDADVPHTELGVAASVADDVVALAAIAQACRGLRTAVHADLAEWTLCHRGRLSLHCPDARAVPGSGVPSAAIVTPRTHCIKVP